MFAQIDQDAVNGMYRINAAILNDSHAVMSVTIDALEELTALAIKHAVDAVNSSAEHANFVLSSEHPHQIINLSAKQIEPASEKMIAMTAEIFRITNTASEKIKDLVNSHLKIIGRDLEASTIEAAQKSLISPEVAIAAVKAATKASKAGYERVVALDLNSKSKDKAPFTSSIKPAAKPRRKSSVV